jgi:hypothetical protein
MAMRSISIDDLMCELFEANVSLMLASPFAAPTAVSVSRSKEVNAKHLAKVYGVFRMMMQLILFK